MKLTEKLGHSLKKTEILMIITYSDKTENVVWGVARKSGSVMVKNWMEIISLVRREQVTKFDYLPLENGFNF